MGGPVPPFSVEIPYGSVRTSDQILIGSYGPSFKDAADTMEGNFRGDKPAFFHITLTRGAAVRSFAAGCVPHAVCFSCRQSGSR